MYPHKQIKKIGELLEENKNTQERQHEMLKFQEEFMKQYFLLDFLKGEELNNSATFKQGLGPCLAYTELEKGIIVGLNGGSNPFFVRGQINDVINAMLSTYVEYQTNKTKHVFSDTRWISKFLEKLGISYSIEGLDKLYNNGESSKELGKENDFIIYLVKFFRISRGR